MDGGDRPVRFCNIGRCRQVCVRKDNGEYLAVCERHHEQTQQTARKSGAKRNAERKPHFEMLRAQQGYGPTDPMPTICGCSYRLKEGVELVFERKSDRSWKRTCTNCTTSNRKTRAKQAARIKEQVQRNADTKECIRCFLRRPREEFLRPARVGGILEFQKCNACSRDLCVAARERHVEWRARFIAEMMQDYSATGCTGYGQGRDDSRPCPFKAVLDALHGKLPDRHFGLLLDYDHYTANGPIEDYQLVSKIDNDEVRREHRSRCFLKCAFCHHMKSIFCGDYLHGNRRWEQRTEMNPNVSKLELKKARYRGQDRNHPAKCQGPNYGETCLFQGIFDAMVEKPCLIPENFHFGRFFEWDHVRERRWGAQPPSRITNFVLHLQNTDVCDLRCRCCHRIKTDCNFEAISFRLNWEDFLEEEPED